ncbi:PAS domain S-box-containing protein [Pelolinea submarina]|uniref:histidine kinase n=1 Tax=Pelolinea submarina TaxID=913107 RepID=A0A3E0AGM6_9CHLR|nr:PAS domain S-box-containing protein [Pelolinea submarina]
MILNNPFSRASNSASEFHLNSEDFRILLDQINDAAVLIKLAERQVVAVNYRYTQLSGFGTEELNQGGIERVLLDADVEKLTDGSMQQLSLIRKNKNPIKTTVNVYYISQVDQLAVLRIQEMEAEETRTELLSIRLLKGLLALNKALPGCSLEELIQNIVRYGQEAFLAKTATFYLCEKESEQARKITEEEPLFPKSLTAIEIKRLNQVDVWEPGKRVLSEIHRTGRLNKLALIISLPITVNDNTNGLLVLAWEDQQKQDDWMIFLQIYAEWAEVLLTNQQIMEKVGATNEALGLENDQYAQFYENAGDSAILLDKNNVIIDINRNSAQLLKYAPIELINQKAEIIFENSELPAKLEGLNPSESISSSTPKVIYDREGNKTPVFYKLVPLEREESGRKLLILTDASIQVEAEYKIQQYENKAALGEVIADFAHEVRNPLQSFVSGLQLMKKLAKADDPSLGSIEQMLDDCSRINDLMESVLSYSRQKVENFKEVNVEMLVRHLFNKMKPKFTRSNVSAMVNCKGDACSAYADQRSLEQIFVNIITNSYDAIKEEGGVISVQIAPNEADSHYLDVSISDTGPGIPPEIQEKIFEPFVTGKPKGTGLGLAITKRMVEAHKGRIELETYPGGTIFKVILPIEEISGDQA